MTTTQTQIHVQAIQVLMGYMKTLRDNLSDTTNLTLDDRPVSASWSWGVFHPMASPTSVFSEGKYTQLSEEDTLREYDDCRGHFEHLCKYVLCVGLDSHSVDDAYAERCVQTYTAREEAHALHADAMVQALTDAFWQQKR